MDSSNHHPPELLARRVRLRWAGYLLLVVAFLLAFFHRNTPAAMADALAIDWSAGPGVLGAISASYFWVYTLMQVPAGVLADLYGPRRLVAFGMAVAAAGTLLTALASGPISGALGRVLIGFGVAFPFIGLLKFSAVWFPERQFATLSGLTIFVGNLGAALAATPLVLLMGLMRWQELFLLLAGSTFLLALAIWRSVYDRPEHVGLPPVHAPLPSELAAGKDWRAGLRRVVANRATWPGFFINFGAAGGIFGFAGLWGMPFLQDVYGFTRAEAAHQTGLMMVACAVGGLVIGRLSDRLGRRRPVLLIWTAVHTLLWLPWMLAWPLSVGGSTLLALLLGFSSTSFALTWACAKEVNPPALSGMATGVVNTGAFLGGATIQQAIGLAVEFEMTAGSSLGQALAHAVWAIPVCCAVGVLAALLQTETYARNISCERVSAGTRPA